MLQTFLHNLISRLRMFRKIECNLRDIATRTQRGNAPRSSIPPNPSLNSAEQLEPNLRIGKAYSPHNRSALLTRWSSTTASGLSTSGATPRRGDRKRQPAIPHPLIAEGDTRVKRKSVRPRVNSLSFRCDSMERSAVIARKRWGEEGRGRALTGDRHLHLLFLFFFPSQQPLTSKSYLIIVVLDQ